MHEEFIKTIDTAYEIGQNKDIPYSERREIIKWYVKKANSIYRKIYKDLSFWERREARVPINDLKNYFKL